MNRRRALTLIGTVGLAGVAGCVGENGEVTATAAPAAIPAGERQGYEANGPEPMEINETVEIAGVSRDVSVSTWSAAYAAPESQTGVFLVSTPDKKVGGISVNPLTRLSGADLIVRVINQGLGQAGGDMAVESIEQETEITASVLGEDRTIPVFSGVLDIGSNGSASEIEGAENGEVPIKLYVLSVSHESDVLLAVGFHPESVSASEEITSLMEAIEHPVEVDAGSTSA